MELLRSINKIFRLVLVAVLCFVLFAGQRTVNITYAESKATINLTYVLDDLLSSNTENATFDLSKYKYDSDGSIELITFLEYGYSQTSSKDYGLYVYIFNPQKLYIADSGQNKIQMGVEYDSNGDVTVYQKFQLKLVNRSTKSGYDGLFYKFKVEQNLFYNIVDPLCRRYSISGIELLTEDDRNATEYKIGGTYYYKGYSKGYAGNSMSTLTCKVDKLETIDLTVHQTNYRTGVSSQGKNHYNNVSTVYFAVPDKYYRKYGNLQKIQAEWWEYKTRPIMVTSSDRFYQAFLPYTKVYLPERDSNVPVALFSGYTDLSSGSFPFLIRGSYYNWAYNISSYDDDSFFYEEFVNVENYCPMIPYAFFSSAVENNEFSVYNLLQSTQNVGGVDSNILKDWIYNYSNDLGRGYIDCNNRSISADLFEDYVDEGRTRGYNNVSVDLEDTFDLNSYDSNHSWWDKFWAYGFNFQSTDEEHIDVAPIYEIQASDLLGSDLTISKNLLVNESDVRSLQAYYASQKALGNHVILFRFATTDYFCENKGCMLNDQTIIGDYDKKTYVAQETVFLDFDIISLTFNKDGVYSIIPVIASPIDIVPSITAPPTSTSPWKAILAIILLVLLVVLLWPILPYIGKFLIWLILLPFKALSALFRGISNHRRRRPKREKSEKPKRVKERRVKTDEEVVDEYWQDMKKRKAKENCESEKVDVKALRQQLKTGERTFPLTRAEDEALGNDRDILYDYVADNNIKPTKAAERKAKKVIKDSKRRKKSLERKAKRVDMDKLKKTVYSYGLDEEDLSEVERYAVNRDEELAMYFAYKDQDPIYEDFDDYYY